MPSDFLTQFRSKLINGASILAAISGLGYICALLFEIGYLNFFGINYMAAEVTTRSFVLFALMGLGVAIALLPHRGLLAQLWSPDSVPSNPFLRLGVKILRTSVLGALLFLPIVIYYRWWWVLPALVLTQICNAFLDVFFDGRRAKGLGNRISKALNAPLPDTLEKDRPIGIILILMISLCGLSLLMGKYFAASRTTYQEVGKSYLIVKQYGDRMILAEYSGSSQLSGNYRYLNTGDKDIDFRIVGIKDLRKP